MARYARSWNESASITSTGPLSEVLVIGAFSFHASGQRPDSREWPYSGKSFTTRLIPSFIVRAPKFRIRPTRQSAMRRYV